MLGSETLTVIPPGGEPDRFGAPGPAAPPYDVPGCTVYPRTSDEDKGTEQTVVTGLTALLPVDARTLSSKHRIVYRGDTYDVVGKPGQWTFFDGGDAGTQVALEEASDA